MNAALKRCVDSAKCTKEPTATLPEVYVSTAKVLDPLQIAVSVVPTLARPPSRYLPVPYTLIYVHTVSGMLSVIRARVSSALSRT